MAEPIRLGIVGCGGLTQSVHIPCLASLEAFRVVAVCDMRRRGAPEARCRGPVPGARRAAARLPGSRAFTDAERLLAEELDAVLVCAPPAVHEAVTLAALARGRHVFLEKPPSMTADGAGRLVDAAAGKPLRTMVGTMWRHAPAHRMAKEIAARPEFGPLLTFHARYVCPGPGMRMILIAAAREWGYQDHPRVQWDGGFGYADGVMRPGYREEWQAFPRAIQDGRECHADVEDAWQAMRIVEALNESLREGRPVSLTAG